MLQAPPHGLQPQVDDGDGGLSWQWELQDQGALGGLTDGIAAFVNAVWGPEPKAFIPAVRHKSGHDMSLCVCGASLGLCTSTREIPIVRRIKPGATADTIDMHIVA